jgi:hypothetical protein
MPGTTIGKSLNLGYAGKISRNADAVVDAKSIKSIINGSSVETQPSITFGAAVVQNADNTVSLFGATGTASDSTVVASPTAANFKGIAVGEVKQMTTYGTNAAGSYLPAQPCDVLERGTATVICTEGTPTANGNVYVVTVAGTTSPVGAFTATATPVGTGAAAVQLTNAKWTTGKLDANNIAEVTLLSRNTI